MSEFSLDTYVRKKSGAFWEGTVVGHYSTEQTPDGVAVQLFGWPNGPVQIYPAAALEPCPEAGNMGSRSPNLGASFEIVAAAYAQDERAALGIEAAFLAGAKFGAMRAANECLAALPKRQGLETGEAMPGNASEAAGAPAPPPSTHVRVRPASAEDVNKAFDPANEVLGGAFMAGFREGWIYAEIDADGERYQEMAEEYAMAVDTAPGEAWDAHRATFFAMLPLAAIPEMGAPIADTEAEIARVVQSVNEWDDRTSPDDYPEHLLITSEELADLLRNFAATLATAEGKEG